MKQITIQYGKNINFYWVDLSKDVWDNISDSSIALVNSLFITDNSRNIPIKSLFLNHLGNKEHKFVWEILNIGMNAPLYRSNYLTCNIDDTNSNWRNILKSWWYESEHWFIEIKILLALLYKRKWVWEKTSSREKYTTIEWLNPEEARLSLKEIDDLRKYVNFAEFDEVNNKIDIMILMYFFLEIEFYIVLPYWTFKESIICSEQWLSEYIHAGKLDASIIYKRSDVADVEKTSIVVDENLNEFIETVRIMVWKVSTPQLSDNQLLNKFFGIINDATIRYKEAIEIHATISKRWTIKWTLRTRNNNPSSYKKMEENLDDFGKVSKIIHDGRTTWIEIEKSIKINE